MLLLWLTACDPAGTAVLVPWVSTDPIEAVIGFEETWIPVEIRNTGTESASVSLSVSAPFRLLPDRVRIDEDDAATVQLVVTPSDYRRLEATITLRTSLQSASTPVDVTIDADGDGDGFTALAAGGDDCDDTRGAVHPFAVELCNDRDDDCNDLIDDDPADSRDWFQDKDADRWGSTLVANACDRPPGAVQLRGDCDDTNDAVFPGAAEHFYDGVDQDCDGGSDYDADGDGFDSDGFGGDDCNDGNPNAHPGASDPLGGSDLDCDGIA